MTPAPELPLSYRHTCHTITVTLLQPRTPIDSHAEVVPPAWRDPTRVTVPGPADVTGVGRDLQFHNSTIPHCPQSRALHTSHREIKLQQNDRNKTSIPADFKPKRAGAATSSQQTNVTYADTNITAQTEPWPSGGGGGT